MLTIGLELQEDTKLRITHGSKLKEQKRAALLREKKASSRSMSPPRVVVLFGLSDLVDLNALDKYVVSFISGEVNKSAFLTVASAEYKLRITIGRFNATGYWKIPAGNLDEIDTKFVEILGYLQLHRTFFQKPGMLFLCTLRPMSCDIRKLESEIVAARLKKRFTGFNPR